MKITEITVSAGRTFNNPYEQYANLRPAVELRATLEEGEEPLAELKKLQAQAETLVEHHKARLLSDLDKLHRYTERTRDIAQLESRIANYTEQLAEAKAAAEKEGPLQLTAIDDSEIPF